MIKKEFEDYYTMRLCSGREAKLYKVEYNQIINKSDLTSCKLWKMINRLKAITV